MHCISQTDGRTYSYWNIKSYALRPFHIQLCSFWTLPFCTPYTPYREWKHIVLEQSTAFCFINWAFVQPQEPQALEFYKILRTEEKHNTSFPYPTLSSVSWLKLFFFLKKKVKCNLFCKDNESPSSKMLTPTVNHPASWNQIPHS